MSAIERIVCAASASRLVDRLVSPDGRSLPFAGWASLLAVIHANPHQLLPPGAGLARQPGPRRLDCAASRRRPAVQPECHVCFRGIPSAAENAAGRRLIAPVRRRCLIARLTRSAEPLRSGCSPRLGRRVWAACPVGMTVAWGEGRRSRVTTHLTGGEAWRRASFVAHPRRHDRGRIQCDRAGCGDRAAGRDRHSMASSDSSLRNGAKA
jgi:hypothetical protein